MDPSRSVGSPLVHLAVGDLVRLRRPHPCGGRDWRIVRTGADIGITCGTCGRRVLLQRRDLERRILAVFPADAGNAT